MANIENISNTIIENNGRKETDNRSFLRETIENNRTKYLELDGKLVKGEITREEFDSYGLQSEYENIIAGDLTEEELDLYGGYLNFLSNLKSQNRSREEYDNFCDRLKSKISEYNSHPKHNGNINDIYKDPHANLLALIINGLVSAKAQYFRDKKPLKKVEQIDEAA